MRSRAHPNQRSLRFWHARGRAGALRPDAARSARGRASGRGRGRGPRASSGTPSCCATATAATSSTATATGRWRRSSPTSTPGGTTSTSRSRTGSTTSTSARSCAPPTPSSPPRSTSSATAAGTVAARWSPTATSTSATTPTRPSLAAYLHGIPRSRRPGAAARHRQPAGLAAPRDDGAAAAGVLPVRAGGPGAVGGRARGVRRHLLDRAVRLDPLDQRQLGGRDRDAQLGPGVRRPRRRGRLARVTAASCARRDGRACGPGCPHIIPDRHAARGGGSRGRRSDLERSGRTTPYP